MKRLQMTLGVALTVYLLFGSALSFNLTVPSSNPVVLMPSSSGHLALGNPNGATDNPSNRDNFLLEKPQYIMSYNNSLGHPNWVSWHVDSSDLGDEERGQFMPDDSLPRGFTKILPTDYRGSGFDRGHLCPSGDRTSTREDNDATFFMTNMIPQAPGNNQGPWANLEIYGRSLVKQRSPNELYVIAGGVGSLRRIARGKVNVPARTWKIMVVLPEGDNDVRRINANTRVIAVDMPNTNIRNTDWRCFRVSIDSIEEKTGYDFLSALPDRIQDAIEARVDRVGRPSRPCPRRR